MEWYDHHYLAFLSLLAFLLYSTQLCSSFPFLCFFSDRQNGKWKKYTDRENLHENEVDKKEKFQTLFSSLKFIKKLVNYQCVLCVYLRWSQTQLILFPHLGEENGRERGKEGKKYIIQNGNCMHENVVCTPIQVEWVARRKKWADCKLFRFYIHVFSRRTRPNDCFLFSSLPLLLHVIVMVKKVWLLSPLLVISSWNDSLFKSSQCTLFGMAHRHRHTSHFTLIIIFLLPSHHSLQVLLNMYVNATWWWRHGDLLSTAAALLSALILFSHFQNICISWKQHIIVILIGGSTTKHHFSHFLSRKKKTHFPFILLSVWRRILNG